MGNNLKKVGQYWPLFLPFCLFVKHKYETPPASALKYFADLKNGRVEGTCVNTPISKWRNAERSRKPCNSDFIPDKPPHSNFIKYNYSLLNFL